MASSRDPSTRPSTTNVDKVKVPTILEMIRAQRLIDVENSQSCKWTSPSILSISLALHTAPPQLDFVARIKSTLHTAVMAEIKRASPSKGDIAPSINAPEQAIKYALAGASVISVLTEPNWFKGSLGDMLSVRQALDALPNRPAVLRKDFILSTYMIDEARLYGADSVLLIVAMLDKSLLEKLYHYALSLGMEPLVEVNNPIELQTALEIGAKVVGVNNRNLHDFNVDMSTTSRVKAALKGQDVVLCALSGISSPKDVEKYAEEGVRAVLVGESLMRAADPFTFLRSLIGLPPPLAVPRPRPLVKVCGCTTSADARLATELGADMIGVVLTPGENRRIEYGQAAEISAIVRSARSAAAFSPPLSIDVSHPWFTFQASQLVSRKKPLLVGVFRDRPLPEILSAIDTIGLDMVQLDGDEPQSWARFLPVPVIKTFRGDATGSLVGGQIDRPGMNQFVLLNAGDPSNAGRDDGNFFDWTAARSRILAGEIGSQKRYSLPLLLTGGLTADNVARVLDELPGVLGVEVSAATDLDVGEGENEERIRAFVHAVKGRSQSVD